MRVGNYGWRNREGAHDNVTSRPLAYQPRPIRSFEYGAQRGVRFTGGLCIAALGSAPRFAARYFFADYSGRLWSLALTIDAAGEARASERREHTAELGGNAMWTISSFGVRRRR